MQIDADLVSKYSALTKGRVRVEDADTVQMPGEEKTTRIKSVDAQETAKYGKRGQPLADLATDVTQEAVDAGATFEGDGERDRYKRHLRTMTREDGEDHGEFLVRQGLAAPMSWSTQEQSNQEMAGSVLRAGLLPGMQTPEERDIQARRAEALEGDPWVASPSQAGSSGRNRTGTSRAALVRGVDNMQGMFNAFETALADQFGNEDWEANALERMERNQRQAAANPPRVADFDAVLESPGKFPTYAVEAVLENLPNMGVTLVGGLAGLATGGAGALTVGALGGAGMRAALLGAGKRFALGSAAASYGLGAGEVQREFLDNGIDASGTALIAGIPMAALDALGIHAVIGGMFKGVSTSGAIKILEASGANLWKEAAKSAGKGLAFGVLAEAPTEALQEIIVLTARAYEDPTFELMTEENIKRVREAAIKGGIAGGVMAGAGRTVVDTMELSKNQGLAKEYGITPDSTEQDVETARTAAAERAAQSAQTQVADAERLRTVDPDVWLREQFEAGAKNSAIVKTAPEHVRTALKAGGKPLGRELIARRKTFEVEKAAEPAPKASGKVPQAEWDTFKAHRDDVRGLVEATKKAREELGAMLPDADARTLQAVVEAQNNALKDLVPKLDALAEQFPKLKRQWNTGLRGPVGAFIEDHIRPLLSPQETAPSAKSEAPRAQTLPPSPELGAAPGQASPIVAPTPDPAAQPAATAARAKPNTAETWVDRWIEQGKSDGQIAASISRGDWNIAEQLQRKGITPAAFISERRQAKTTQPTSTQPDAAATSNITAQQVGAPALRDQAPDTPAVVSEVAGSRPAEQPGQTAVGAERVAPRVELTGRSAQHLPKDQAKSDKATQFIGVGARGSSTEGYRQAWGDRANTGTYTADDTVFLSVNGRARGTVARVPFEASKSMVQAAVDAGATIITDTKHHRDLGGERGFNIGEREAAAFLEANGYREEAGSGVWKPSASNVAPSAKPRAQPTVGEEITAAFDAIERGIKEGGLERDADRLAKGEVVDYTKPGAVQAALVNPNYNVVERPDGSVNVVGVLDPRTKEWVGQAPSASNVAPSASNVAPSASNVAPSASNVAPSASNVAPSASNVAPSTETQDDAPPLDDDYSDMQMEAAEVEAMDYFDGATFDMPIEDQVEHDLMELFATANVLTGDNIEFTLDAGTPDAHTLQLPLSTVSNEATLDGRKIPATLLWNRILEDPEGVTQRELMALALESRVYSTRTRKVREYRYDTTRIGPTVDKPTHHYPLIDDIEGAELIEVHIDRDVAYHEDESQQVSIEDQYKQAIGNVLTHLAWRNESEAQTSDQQLVLAARKKGHLLVMTRGERKALYEKLGLSVEDVIGNTNTLGRIGATVFRIGGHDVEIDLGSIEGRYANDYNDGTMVISHDIDGIHQGTLVVDGPNGTVAIGKGTARGVLRATYAKTGKTAVEQAGVATDFLFGKKITDEGLAKRGRLHMTQLDSRSGASLPYQAVLADLEDPAGYLELQTTLLDARGIDGVASANERAFIKAGWPAALTLNADAVFKKLKSFNIPAVRDYALGSNLVPKNGVMLLPDTLADYARQAGRMPKAGETIYLHREPSLPTGTGTIAVQYAGTMSFGPGSRQTRGIVVNPKNPDIKGMALDFDGDRLVAIARHKGFVPRMGSETRPIDEGDTASYVTPSKRTITDKERVKLAEKLKLAEVDPIDAAIHRDADGLEDRVGEAINLANKLIESGHNDASLRVEVARIAQAMISSVKKAIDRAATFGGYDQVSDVVSGHAKARADGKLGKKGKVKYLTSLMSEMERGPVEKRTEALGKLITQFKKYVGDGITLSPVEAQMLRRAEVLLERHGQMMDVIGVEKRVPPEIIRSAKESMDSRLDVKARAKNKRIVGDVAKEAGLLTDAINEERKRVRGEDKDNPTIVALKRQRSDLARGLGVQVRLGRIDPAAVIAHAPPWMVTVVLRPKDVASVLPNGTRFFEDQIGFAAIETRPLPKPKGGEKVAVLETGQYEVGTFTDDDGRITYTLQQLDDAGNPVGDPVGVRGVEKSDRRFRAFLERSARVWIGYNALGDVAKERSAGGTEKKDGTLTEPSFRIQMTRLEESWNEGVVTDPDLVEASDPHETPQVTLEPVEGVGTVIGAARPAKALRMKLGNLLDAVGLGKDFPVTVVPSNQVDVLSAAYDARAAEIEALIDNGNDDVRLLNDLAEIRDTQRLLAQPLESPGRVLYNDRLSNPADRVPIVVVDTKAASDAVMKVIAHELGHIVERQFFDRADARTRSNMFSKFEQSETYKGREQGSVLSELFSEWFANQMERYALGTLEKGSAELSMTIGGKLKTLWEKLTGAYKLDDSFVEFMQGIHPSDVALRTSREVRGATDLPMYSDYHTEPGLLSAIHRRTIGKVVEKAKFALDKLDTNETYLNFIDTARWAGRNTIQPVGSWMRNRGPIMRELSEQFIRTTDARANYVGKSGPWETAHRMHHASIWNLGFEEALAPLRKHETLWDKFQQQSPGLKMKKDVPLKERFKKKPEGYRSEDEFYGVVTDALIGEVDPSTITDPKARKIVEEVRVALDQALDYANDTLEMGVAKRKNYWPVVVDMDRFGMERDAVIDALMRKAGKSHADAVTIYEDVMNGEGSIIELIDGQLVDNSARVVSPAFEFARARKWDPRVHAALKEYQIRDIGGTLVRYVNGLSKRGTAQQMFGETVTLPNGETKMIPLGKIDLALKKAKDAGQINESEYKFATDTVIPALFGQLGIDGSPEWRMLSSWGVTYQNVRLLGMVVFSSLVDPAVILSRGGVKSTWNGVKDAIFEMSREEAMAQLRDLGAMRTDMTEAIVNDQFAGMYHGAGPQKVNETFFRLVQMHRWTNFSRRLALGTAKRYLTSNAANIASDKHAAPRLNALGVTAEQVKRWQNENMPMGRREHDAVNFALNQFIDDAVLRPTAALRPAWMSDARLMLIAHLKSFFFAFYERAIRHVWTESARVWGAERGASRALALLPALMLVIPALLLASVGYELRRKIGWWGEVPEYMEKDGLDYIWELSQRAGIFGPLQLAIDAEATEDRGRSALLAILGPQADQVQDLYKGMDYAFWRALPGLQQFPAARQWLNQEVW